MTLSAKSCSCVKKINPVCKIKNTEYKNYPCDLKVYTV